MFPLFRSTDEKGWQPIHTSSAAGHVDIVKWLAVNSVNLDEMTPTGYTAMHLAAMNGQTNTMIVLVALGAKLDSKSVEHQTPLHLAAMRCGIVYKNKQFLFKIHASYHNFFSNKLSNSVYQIGDIFI